ncbi:MAG: pirin family protein [Crocinitomicaceae bacterium]|nr:pirin family protein [Crocinitomicaceae bacterium]
MENIIIHRAATRGHADHGWLNARHTFSFANYYHPERVQFGTLRVLNDDTIAPGMGFGTHPHDNMEIITIPLAGKLAHKDSLGNSGVISSGEIQVMSAGTGIQHSEINGSKEEELKLLQIWVFPDKTDVQPRYDQMKLPACIPNVFRQLVSPNPDDEGVWIHQSAWFNLGEFSKGATVIYQLKQPDTNGVYAFVIKGDVSINEQSLNERDGMGIQETKELIINADCNARLLLMEVPMK